MVVEYCAHRCSYCCCILRNAFYNSCAHCALMVCHCIVYHIWHCIVEDSSACDEVFNLCPLLCYKVMQFLYGFLHCTRDVLLRWLIKTGTNSSINPPTSNHDTLEKFCSLHSIQHHHTYNNNWLSAKDRHSLFNRYDNRLRLDTIPFDADL